MKMRFRFHGWCCFCVLALIAASCEVKRPEEVLPESTMESLLYDYHVAKSMGDNLPYNENYKKALYTGAVFRKYGVSEAAFDSSMVWYTRNAEILSKIYEKVNKRFKTEQDAINHLVAVRERKSMTSVAGDSIDVWAWQRVLRLSGMPLDNKLIFSLPSDSNFKERDTLVWEVRYSFFDKKQKPVRPAIMTMQIVYANDSVIGQTKEVSRSGIQRITLQSDTLGAIKEVKGFIYYPIDKPSQQLIADHMTLFRYHSNDTLKALNDSIRAAAVKADSLKKTLPIEEVDTTKQSLQLMERTTPEEMNRRRSTFKRAVKPEQLEVEQHIIEERKDRRVNQRRQQMRQADR